MIVYLAHMYTWTLAFCTDLLLHFDMDYSETQSRGAVDFECLK